MPLLPAHDQAELADLVRELAVVRGRVTLSSGAISDHYFDLRRVSFHPRGFRLIGHAILRAAASWDFDAVAGPALGAVPLALAAMSAAGENGRDLPSAAVRKEPKRHGLGKRCEGADLKDRRVLVVEDTSTTGASTLDVLDAAEREGVQVVGVVLLVDRGGAAAVAAANVPVRSVFTAAELLEGPPQQHLREEERA